MLEKSEWSVLQVGLDGEYVLLDSGPLPEAVAASAAIPFVFENVAVPGGCMKGMRAELRFHA